MALRPKTLSTSMRRALMLNRQEKQILDKKVHRLSDSLEKSISELSSTEETEKRDCDSTPSVRRRKSTQPIRKRSESCRDEVILNTPSHGYVRLTRSVSHSVIPSSPLIERPNRLITANFPNQDTKENFVGSPRPSRYSLLENSRTSIAPHPPCSPRLEPMNRRTSSLVEEEKPRSFSLDQTRTKRESECATLTLPKLTLDVSAEENYSNRTLRRAISASDHPTFKSESGVGHRARFITRENDELRRQLLMTRTLAMGKKRTRSKPLRKRSTSLPDLEASMAAIQDCRYLRTNSQIAVPS